MSAPDLVVEPDVVPGLELDAARLRDDLVILAGRLELPEGVPVRIRIDPAGEHGRARLVALQPIVVEAERGALEDPTRPGHLSHPRAVLNLGRLLLAARDRATPGFDAPPVAEEVPAAVATAWDVWCVARLGRLGYDVSRQRRLVRYRDRVGFTESADAAFERLWEAESLTYPDLVALSADAASGEGPLPT